MWSRIRRAKKVGEELLIIIYVLFIIIIYVIYQSVTQYDAQTPDGPQCLPSLSIYTLYNPFPHCIGTCLYDQ
jgi:hypothetical protein